MTTTSELMTSSGGCSVFRSGPARTVVVWAKRGWLPAIRTPGGIHRFRAEDIRPLRGQGDVIDAAGRFTARNRPLAEILQAPIDGVTADELDRALAFYRERDARREAERRHRIRLLSDDGGEM
jgi:hypothetical protein